MTEPTISHAVKEVLVARVVYGLRSRILSYPSLFSRRVGENLGTRLFTRLHQARCNSDIKGKNISFSGLARSAERLTAEREVAGSIPGTGPILRVLKITEN